MSPVGKKKTPPKEREVKAEGTGRPIKITPAANKTITVAWICGASRTFDIEELRKHIELADGPGTKHPMWLNLKDRGSRPFFVRLQDGKLTANEGMSDNGYVAWADLKRELQATIAEVLA